jgi:radical SAM protein with 4Fe4S-binding SPASM domain
MRSRASPVNPPIETLKKIVDFALSCPHPEPTLEFGIGEPMLRPRVLVDLIRYARRVAGEMATYPDIRVTTNGTRCSEAIIRQLVENDVRIAISLDGPKDLHDRQRPSVDGQSSHEAASRWIRALVEQGYRKVNASVTVTRWNIEHLGDVVAEYVDTGLPSITLRFVGCQGSALQSQDSVLVDNQTIRRYLPDALRTITTLNGKGVRLLETYLSLYCRMLFDRDRPAMTELMSPCGFAIAQLAYAPDGHVFGCEECMSAGLAPLGHIARDNLSSMLSQPIVRQILERSFLDDLACVPCPYLPFCGQCPVLQHHRSNSFLPIKAHSNRCTITKVYLDFIFTAISSDDPAFRAYCDNWGHAWHSVDGITTKGRFIRAGS